MKKIIVGLAAFAIITLCAGYVLAYSSMGNVITPTQKDSINLLGSSKGYSNTNVSFELQTSYPDVPEQVTIYNAESPKVSKESFVTLGKNVGISGSLKEAQNELVLSDSTHILEIHEKSGRMAYIDNVRWNQITGKDTPAAIPSDSEAKKIASEYLSKLDLMPKDAVFSQVEHQQILAVDSTGKTTNVPYEAIKVSYKRSIEGFPVVGAGSKLSVEVGGGGDVLQMYKLWRNYSPDEKMLIITPTQAFDEFKAQGISGISANGSTTVKITKMYLAYYEASAMEEQNQFLPVYVFEGKLDNQGETSEFTEYVPAISDLGPTIPSTK
ncbi:MAG: hypothetical protein WC342_06730 [Methanoregula sp.]|jgi:hypothetical protein